MVILGKSILHIFYEISDHFVYSFCIDNVRTEESHSNNMIYDLLLKSFRSLRILAAIDYDKKMKTKSYKFDKYCHKLAMHVMENEIYNDNFE